MLIPKYTPADLTSETFSCYSVFPEKYLTDIKSVDTPLPKGSNWVEINILDDVVEATLKLLDAGVSKVLFNEGKLVPELLEFPQDRLGVIISVQNATDLAERVAKYSSQVSVVVLKLEANFEEIFTALESISSKTTLQQNGGAVRLVVDGIDLDLATIERLSAKDIDVSLPVKSLSVDSDGVGKALGASLVSDRPDGLFTTIVVDEQGVCLGLVYSSVESLNESIKTGTGVYQSRKRGLWYKGATSGATQELLKIDTDCDRDALRFTVRQNGSGFCHLNTRTCFGVDEGITSLYSTLTQRKESTPPKGSYTARLFNEPNLLHSKIIEEAHELCDAVDKEEIAWEAADLIYFALTKCVANGVTLSDVERHLNKRSKKITRRPGNAKPQYEVVDKAPVATPSPVVDTPKSVDRIEMKVHSNAEIDASKRSSLLLRPIIKSEEIISRVQPILKEIRANGDQAIIDLTEKFDGVKLKTPVIKAPFPKEMMQIDERTKAAIDQAYDNIYKFHDAQYDRNTLVVETMPGVICSRFSRPIERVGLYVPGGTAILPSTTLMLGIPAKVAGCKEIIVASPPRKDGSVVPEVLYVADKIGASMVVCAGGAQAVGAMAYGTESVPKVDKICGPGNQYVTAAKMIVQNDSSAMTSIDMPAGPSELLVIADSTCTPSYVASDLLSQAEHGIDSQVVLVAVDLSEEKFKAIEDEVHNQASRLPRVEIVRQSIPKSFALKVTSMEEAMSFSNDYAPEHLILHLDEAEKYVDQVENAGSVFVGPWSPESCGDYASGTNHTLPTYGYSRMYSGVNTDTFLKYITSQQLTSDGLDRLADSVMRLAEIEGLEAHRNAVAVRVQDIRK
ncbi:trifunctional histidinol dehydrogenase [Basidiobolus ranarum]|uniref:Histidine biosynthesis trifunctional protein n=1 Tax=Basidiobolus ranarum TaxID=34480 RepID=A0ABR2VSW9_9FUNG